MSASDDDSSNSNQGDEAKSYSDCPTEFYHLQPSSLSIGYGSSSFVARPVLHNSREHDLIVKGEAPYIAKEYISKQRCSARKSRLKGYANWLDFKKPLDERRLCQAVSMNDTATVYHLLNQGVSARCCDSQKRSPLHLASCKGYSHIVKILLEYGADPNALDSIGNTPLHLAACTNHINVIMLLLNAGTNSSSIDKLGRNPLQLAQSKLKILQRSQVSDEDIKSQVGLVIGMLRHFSNQGEETLDPELLSKFQTQVQISDTREKVNNQVQELLDNLSSLSLSTGAAKTSSNADT